jgi:hypothetical protein
MRRPPRIAVLLPLTLLLGCGAAPTSTPSPSTYLNLTGNWEAAGNPVGTTGLVPIPSPIANFTGALQSTNGSVTGTLRVSAFAASGAAICPSFDTDLPATGALDTANNLTLTVPLSGGVATITATLPQNLHTFISGSYQVVGGTCPMPATPMKLTQYASATGTYTGTFSQGGLTTPVPGTATPVTVVLTQSATPNADGQFPLIGSITATGSCAATLTITTGIVTGSEITPTPLGPILPSAVEFLGVIDPTAETLVGLFGNFPTCGSQGYQGTLTRQ